MKNKPTMQMIISTLVCLAPMLLAVLMYDKLPAEIPIHFNAAGEADNFASKALACFGLPAFFAVINLLMRFMINADPKRENAIGVVRSIGLWTVPVAALAVQMIVLFKSIGYDIPVEMIVPMGIGVLIIIIGNYLPKCKQNYTVGIKVPWTLDNEDNWNKTHRLAGVLWMIGGFLIVVSAFIKGLPTGLMLCIMAALVIIPVGYSYLLSRKGM